MTKRSFTKMNAVASLDDDRVYIQTGFAQRGLGIGWRLEDPEEIRPYYELMPVSLGCVSLWADVRTIQERNRTRIPVKDRAYMVPAMEEPLRIAVETLRNRGVPMLELDMREPIERNRDRLLDFAQAPVDA